MAAVGNILPHHPRRIKASLNKGGAWSSKVSLWLIFAVEIPKVHTLWKQQ
jgi:hypothetical protein